MSKIINKYGIISYEQLGIIRNIMINKRKPKTKAKVMINHKRTHEKRI